MVGSAATSEKTLQKITQMDIFLAAEGVQRTFGVKLAWVSDRPSGAGFEYDEDAATVWNDAFAWTLNELKGWGGDR